MGASWIDVPGKGPILRQEGETNCCGYCCVAMIVNLITGTKLPLSSVLSTAKSKPGYVNWKGGADYAGAVPTVGVKMGEIVSVGEGSYGDHLHHVLKSLLNTYCGANKIAVPSVAFHETKIDDLKKKMRKVTAEKPMIVRVEWPGGGGHWVVVSGRNTRGLGKASDYTILDPLGSFDTNRGSTNYDVGGNHGAFAANDGWCYYVTVGA